MVKTKETLSMDKEIVDAIDDALRNYRRSFGKKSMLHEAFALAYLTRTGIVDNEIARRKINEYKERGLNEDDISAIYLMAGIDYEGHGKPNPETIEKLKTMEELIKEDVLRIIEAGKISTELTPEDEELIRLLRGKYSIDSQFGPGIEAQEKFLYD